MGSKQLVLSLYRQILRLSKTWESASGLIADTHNERDYIRTEARELFRKNKEVVEEGEVKEYIREAETRIELAQHYGIPYPRPVNIPQNTLPPGKRKLRAQARALDQSLPIYMRSYKDKKDDQDPPS